MHRRKQHITHDVILNGLLRGLDGIVQIAIDPRKYYITHVLRMPQWEGYYPSSITKTMTTLLRKGLVDVQEKNGVYIVQITDQGKSEVLRYDIAAMAVPDQTPWDEKWRMVLFDISKDRESIRAAFRQSLQSMGFFQMQKSVYIHPYPCTKQIQFLREVYGIPHAVKMATITHLENDEDLRTIFRLPPNE
jgi:DNA-binding transcriptional regulator PaaX